jgi:hypothetical protein
MFSSHLHQLWPALWHLEQRISCLSSTDSLFTFDLFERLGLTRSISMAYRALLGPLFFHIMVLSITYLIIGLSLLFIQKWDKTRRSSVNQHLQSVIGSHKGGPVKIPTETIAHNNNVQIRNMNQLWHTTGASVLR